MDLLRTLLVCEACVAEVVKNEGSNTQGAEVNWGQLPRRHLLRVER